MRGFIPLLIVLSLGCAEEVKELPEEWLPGIPTSDMLLLELPGLKTDAPKTVYLDLSLDRVRFINQTGAGLVDFIAMLTSGPYAEELDTGYRWGPAGDEGAPAEMLFDLTRQTESGPFAYRLAWRALDSAEEAPFADVVTGSLSPTPTESKVQGNLAIDFSAAAGQSADLSAAGKLTFDHASAGNARTIYVVFNGFQPDPDSPALSAVYEYERDADGGGSLSWTTNRDIHQDDPDLGDLGKLEVVEIELRWTASGAGRAKVTATSGDLPDINPPVDSIDIHECWDKDLNQIFWAEIAHPTGMDPMVWKKEGDMEACQPETEYTIR